MKISKKKSPSQMVREGEKVSIHSWSMAEQKWTKIGDVVGAAGGSEVREYIPSMIVHIV
jgi:hypothetical protein